MSTCFWAVQLFNRQSPLLCITSHFNLSNKEKKRVILEEERWIGQFWKGSITTFCLLFKVKICFQLFFRLPCCAIDSLKHWFIFISSPVSSSNRFKFNSIPVYISSGINMWSSTKVPPFITCKKCVKFDVKTSKSIWGIWRDQIGWYQCKLKNISRYRFYTVCLKTRRKITHTQNPTNWPNRSS